MASCRNGTLFEKKKKLNTAEWGYVGMNSGYQLGCKTLLYSLILSMQSLRPLLPIVGNFLLLTTQRPSRCVAVLACPSIHPSWWFCTCP